MGTTVLPLYCAISRNSVGAVFSQRGRIFLLLKAARTFKFGLALHNPGVGGLLAVEGFRFSMNDLAGLFDDDLGGKSLGAIFAGAFYD